jgi:hypothetical protein
LDIEGLDLSLHNFVQESLSRDFFLWFHGSSGLITWKIHTRWVDIIIEFFDNSFESVQQKFDKGIGVYILPLYEVIFNTAQTLTNSNEIYRSLVILVVNRMENSLHLVIDFSIRSQLIKSKEILFKVEVEIRFYVTESNWVIEEETFKFADVGFIFDHKETVKIENDVIQFITDNLLHVDFDFRLEIVQSV